MFKSLTRKKQEARYLLRLSRKVYTYRRDVMSPKQLTALKSAQKQLETSLEDPDAGEHVFELEMHRLDDILKDCGGTIYPVTFWNENIEMFLLAAIVALGIRAFFFQPFKIPTNSMYPTYSGMTPYLYKLDEPPPSLLKRFWNFVLEGSEHYTIEAPASGKVEVPIFAPNEPFSNLGRVRFKKVQGRKWFGFLPATYREYALQVGGKSVTLRVPWDFSLDDVVLKTYFPHASSLDELILKSYQKARAPFSYPTLATHLSVKEGDTILNFDIQTGDMLFVDRVTYNFRRPKLGEPIVFHTRKIRGMQHLGLPTQDQYYIKRLVGMNGDRLEVREPRLYRNGAPITGTEAFELNHKRTAGYRGYRAVERLSPGMVERIPEGYYYGMGDNSNHSADSRYFGFVPEREVIGKACLIFYPFSKRIGLAK